MTEAKAIQRIVLAIEGPDLEAGAREFSYGLTPNAEIELCNLEEFEHRLDQPYQPGELLILMLHADEQGQLRNGSALVQRIMNSSVPVMVIRQRPGGAIPETEVRRIIVPLDGSSTAGQAIPVASQVSQMLGVPVQFVMVIDPSRVIPPAYAYDPDAWGMIEELRQTSHWALSQAESALQRDGVSVTSRLLFGPINASLAECIGEGDLVVMTTHGSDPHVQRTRGSVALRTLVSVPQPMLIMRARSEVPIVVDAYQACSWAEPLQRDTVRTA